MASQTLVCSTCSTPLPESAAFCWVCGTPTPTGTTPEGSATRPSLQSAAAVVDTRKRLERALGAQFTVKDLVGRGGFAEVFAVHDTRLKRDLAVKVLSPELVVNQAMLTRFRREAEAIAALRHPSIVPIYDIGESGGIAYIVMPLIKGDTLRKRMEERIPVAESLRILGQIADALAVAHAAQLVHRDIKPENVMLEGPREQVLVMDFGIAKAIDPESTGVTTSGLIVGTPHYMSPEQASGEQVDARSDQYSLAVMGYRMMTGTHPFEAETTRAILYKQVFESAPLASERDPSIPAAIAQVLHRGMSKDAQDRFDTIEEFSTALTDAAQALEEAPAPLAPPPPAAIPAQDREPEVASASGTVEDTAESMVTTPVVRPRPRDRRLGVVLIGAVVVLAAFAVWGVLRPRGEPAFGGSSTTTAASAPTDSGAGGAGSDVVVIDPPANAAAPNRNPQPRGSAPVAATPGEPTRATPPRRPANEPTYASCAQAMRAQAWEPAVSLCRAEADGGAVAAQEALGSLYERGLGIPVDPASASTWYRQAANAGSGLAAFRLGAMLEEGRGVDVNVNEAGQMYLQAARRGVVDAMFAAGRFYESGRGLPSSERDAVNWFRRAAAGGNTQAQLKLGELYANGRMVSKNEAEAARWYERAADAGNADAQYALGMAYLYGRGVTASDSVAVVWLQRASRQGHAQAAQELARRNPGS